ncbi:MAG: HAD family hydrolase [Dehalococcoidia bacterium]
MRGVKLPEPVQPRAVVFSLGALCTYDRANEMAAAAFRAIVERFTVAGDASEKFGLFCSRFAQAARWYQSQRFYLQRDMLRDARAAGLRALGVQSTATDEHELDRLWFDCINRSMKPRPEAYALIECLRDAGVKVGIISNADCDEFSVNLAGTRFAELADVLICSEQAGSCKPDPMIFYEALKRLGVRPAEALYVGTTFELDVRGAVVVGMRSVLLSGQSPRWWDQPGVEPDFVVSTLSEVATLVTLPAPAGGPRVRRRASGQPVLAGG